MTWLLFGSWILQKRLWFSHSFQYEHRPFFKVTKSQVKSKFFFDSHGILQQRPRFRNFRGVAISKKKYIFAAAFFFLEEEVVQKLDAPKISAAPTKVGFVEGGGMCCFVFFSNWLHLKLPNRKLIRLPISRYHTSIWIKNRTCHFFSTFLPCSLKIKALPAPSAGTPASLPAGGPEAKLDVGHQADGSRAWVHHLRWPCCFRVKALNVFGKLSWLLLPGFCEDVGWLLKKPAGCGQSRIKIHGQVVVPLPWN